MHKSFQVGTKTFVLDKAKENIIDAGLKSGIELPYSCKGGVCSTCRAKLVAGEVDMDVNFALEDYEVARGFVFGLRDCSCIARTNTPRERGNVAA